MRARARGRARGERGARQRSLFRHARASDDDTVTDRRGIARASMSSASARGWCAPTTSSARVVASGASSRRARVRAKDADVAGGEVASEHRAPAFGPSRADARAVRDALVDRSLAQAGWDDARGFLAKRASTALGKEACETLEAATSSREAERALDETEAAMAMESKHGVSLDFGGMLTAEVRRAFFKTRQGSPLGGDELAATAAFLESARRLKASIEGVTVSGELPVALEPLRKIVRDMMTHAALAEKIRSAVEETGEFRDNASPELRRARSQKGAAEGKLKKAMQGKGTPTMHQGRMVLAVAAPPPPDALVVGTLMGGAMVLIEPPGIVALNRELAQAVDAEKSAIDAIKRDLSNEISFVVEELLDCLEIVIKLDVITAKCRYSQALNGVRPEFSAFTDEAELIADDAEAVNDVNERSIRPEKSTLLLELVGLRQPILVSQAIEVAMARRQAAAEAAAANSLTATQQSGYKIATRGAIKSAAAKEDEFDYFDEDDDGDEEDEQEELRKVKGPVPVDIFASKRTKVVVITGPNTGGKTAAMKAVGVVALMAKSGIFIPAERAVLPFFDKVLVDIGDDQSLLTSLSTFSGRLTRAQAILEQCTPESLVLMDEVGTGTSPGEGAAIGYALLKALAGIIPGQLGACLTFATTHHGQLKALKYEHEEFENAAVEFDEADLRPTYKLLWGVPGRSSALQIATRFNLDNEVIQEAREVLGEGLVSLDDTISKLETARRDADADITTAIRLLDEVDSTLPKVDEAVNYIQSARDSAAYAQASAVIAMMRESKAKIAEALRKEKQQNAVAPSQISAAASGETERERIARLAREAAEQAKAEQEALVADWIPSIGEDVKIISTGMSGKVVSLDGLTVVVQAGRLQIKANLEDISQPFVASSAPPKMRLRKIPGASQAARRVDELVATSARVVKPAPSNNSKSATGDFELSDDDMLATVGDIVVVKKTGFKGKVIDNDDGLLTVQAGPQRVLAPAHTVAIVGPSADKKQISKKKKDKPSFKLPSATNNENPATDTSSASNLAALQAKFGRKK